ncbi:MAG: ABC transporter ATP-binding protein [Tannerella sp.]|jgi:iron complex transport system ATP-binding protein|nr:ABC transporter ATP-binding protein [Tannerella sp.]
MQRQPVIETSGLIIGYARKYKRSRIVHDDLNLRLYKGELTSLLGLNGAGKSTLLHTICGFLPALGGDVLVNGRPLSKYSQVEMSRIIGVVLTDKTNAGGITVVELVSLGRHPYTGFFGRLGAEDRLVVEQSLDAVGMAHKSKDYISELSDGERQKVMIAKALAQQCPIIILDEPTAYLDVTSRIEIMSLLHRLSVEQKKAILLSTHDLDLAIRMSDCLWLQEQERDMKCGTPEDLILSGAFETFFDKRGVKFDSSTGKLTAEKPSSPIAIAVEGDYKTSYWVGNALIRNGFRAVSESASASASASVALATSVAAPVAVATSVAVDVDVAESESASGTASEFKIRCEAPNKILLQTGDKVQTLNSVAELITALRQYPPVIARKLLNEFSK